MIFFSGLLLLRKSSKEAIACLKWTGWTKLISLVYKEDNYIGYIFTLLFFLNRLQSGNYDLWVEIKY